ncbi:MAG: phosphatidylserine decarboxylase [Nevskia sp.]|nr:phosphatidylserine decarboxylase [Nevskia sp.]
MRQPPGSEASLKERLFATLQSLLPTRALSALMFRVAQVRHKTFKNALMRWFVHKYAVELGEAEFSSIENYEHFNDFFTRALKPGVRPQPSAPNILSCPVDGTISQFGTIQKWRIFQAKGHDYSAGELLADEQLAHSFYNGSFNTIYLAPHNYHRVHMPCSGRLRSWAYIPGRLFSVNPGTARSVPALFARNERMVAVFDTGFGPMALVMVGAIVVGGIETVWNGRLTPPHLRHAQPTYYQPMHPVVLQRGDELGRFHLGSTVILLAPPGALNWDGKLSPGREMRLGQALATIVK